MFESLTDKLSSALRNLRGVGKLTEDNMAEALKEVRTALLEANIDYESADAVFLPSSEIELDEDQARKVLKMVDALEDSDDVQDVYATYNVSDDIMEKLG